MSIYSTRFFNGGGLTDGQQLFTIPAGKVAVIRDIECLNLTSSVITVLVTLRMSSGTTAGIIAGFSRLGANDAGQWTGRVVLQAGEGGNYAGPSGQCSLCINGYLFDL